jgi:hypothetical protein
MPATNSAANVLFITEMYPIRSSRSLSFRTDLPSGRPQLSKVTSKEGQLTRRGGKTDGTAAESGTSDFSLKKNNSVTSELIPTE